MVGNAAYETGNLLGAALGGQAVAGGGGLRVWVLVLGAGAFALLWTGRDLRDRLLRAVWMLVLGVGLAFAAAGVRPVPATLFAQVANGVLLPAVAVFLLVAANDRRWMGRWANGPALNLAGGLVVLIALVLGARAVATALG